MLPGQVADRIEDLIELTTLAESDAPRFAYSAATVVHDLKPHLMLGTPAWDQVYALGFRIHELAWGMMKDPSARTQAVGRLASACTSAALRRLELKEGDLPLSRWKTLTAESLRTIQAHPEIIDYRGRCAAIDPLSQ